MGTKQNDDQGQDRPGYTPNGPSEEGKKKVTDPRNPTAQGGKKPATDSSKKSTFGRK